MQWNPDGTEKRENSTDLDIPQFSNSFFFQLFLLQFGIKVSIDNLSLAADLLMPSNQGSNTPAEEKFFVENFSRNGKLLVQAPKEQNKPLVQKM